MLLSSAVCGLPSAVLLVDQKVCLCHAVRDPWVSPTVFDLHKADLEADSCLDSLGQEVDYALGRDYVDEAIWWVGGTGNLDMAKGIGVDDCTGGLEMDLAHHCSELGRAGLDV